MLALNVTSAGNNFNDFHDNKQTKFRVFTGWSRIFTSPLNFYEGPRLVPHRMDAPDRHNGQKNVSVCPFDGGWHLREKLSMQLN